MRVGATLLGKPLEACEQIKNKADLGSLVLLNAMCVTRRASLLKLDNMRNAVI